MFIYYLYIYYLFTFGSITMYLFSPFHNTKHCLTIHRDQAKNSLRCLDKMRKKPWEEPRHRPASLNKCRLYMYMHKHPLTIYEVGRSCLVHLSINKTVYHPMYLKTLGSNRNFSTDSSILNKVSLTAILT